MHTDETKGQVYCLNNKTGLHKHALTLFKWEASAMLPARYVTSLLIMIGDNHDTISTYWSRCMVSLIVFVKVKVMVKKKNDFFILIPQQ